VCVIVVNLSMILGLPKIRRSRMIEWCYPVRVGYRVVAFPLRTVKARYQVLVLVARYQYAWYVPVHVLVPVQYQVVLFLYQVPGIAHTATFFKLIQLREKNLDSVFTSMFSHLI
jgi:hypothetical protein